MTPGEALARIRELGAAGRFFVLPHARLRALQRGINVKDIRHGLTNARRATWQAGHETWKVDTSDLDGDALAMAVVIEASAIVVTVF